MKNIFIKFLLIFAFILGLSTKSFATDLGINSVTYDNSSSFVTINSTDSNDYVFTQNPKLIVVKDENKAYFDISSAILKCPLQDLVVNSDGIKELVVSQFSTNPNIVRVVVSYSDGFNPSNIQLKKLDNTLFIRFKAPTVSNYYFQPVYTENKVAEQYESINIQTPVSVQNNNLLGQINSAFNLGQTTSDKNYILTSKDLTLHTKYYVDNVTIKGSDAILTGIGSLSLSKPMYLSSPSRVAYDIPNTVVNPAIRNKEMRFNQADTIKIGQFNRNTARVVITCSNPERYVPVIYPDSQRLVFVDSKALTTTQGLSSVKANLTSVYDDITDISSHTVKLVFSKPVLLGVERKSSALDLNFYNVDRFQDVNLKSAFIFDGIKMTAMKTGGAKLTIPTGKDDVFDIHAGADGKTIRIKVKGSSMQLAQRPTEKIMPVEPVVVPKQTQNTTKVSGKKYIVIDPGHGGSDCGAMRNGIYEKDITLDVSKRVVSLLEKKGYVVKMTRTNDKYVSLQDRVTISEEFKPDIFVSIHVNSSNSDSPTGLETHYYKDNSLKLAKNIHAAMLNNINSKDRGLFKSRFYVINHTTAPAVLVEIGFISSPVERAQLVSESRKQATAKAIAEGIYEYFK